MDDNGLPVNGTSLTVQGVTLSQLRPVIDAKNKVIFEPTAFDINTSIQRCVVKAIALSGLGLYVYAGEDLPVLASDEKRQGGRHRQTPQNSCHR